MKSAEAGERAQTLLWHNALGEKSWTSYFGFSLGYRSVSLNEIQLFTCLALFWLIRRRFGFWRLQYERLDRTHAIQQT